MLYNDLQLIYSQKKIIYVCVYEKCLELPFVGPQSGLEESFELVSAEACVLALALLWDLGDSLHSLPGLCWQEQEAGQGAL